MDEDIKRQIKIFGFMLLAGFIFIALLSVLNNSDTIINIQERQIPTYIDGNIQKVIVKEYNATSQTLRIRNETDIFADIVLLTPLHNIVPSGQDVEVAELEFNIYRNVTNFVGALETLNVKNGRNISKAVTFKYARDTQKVVPDYFLNCTMQVIDPIPVPRENCVQVANGTKTVTVRNWTNINWNTNVRAGTYIVGLFADVTAQEYVEWIPHIAGLRVVEWATWSASLSNGLYAYYNFTDYNNSLNSALYPLVTSAGTPTLVTGKSGLGTAINCSAGSVKHTASYTKFNNNETTDYTISFWDLRYTGGAEKYMMAKDDASAGNWYLGHEASSTMRAWGVSTSQYSWATQNTTWNMHTVSCNATACVYYTNAVRGQVGVKRQLSNSSTTIFSICDYPSYPAGFIGLMDEVAFWNRSLSDADVSTLYSGGAGMTYEQVSGSVAQATITWISPNAPADLDSTNGVAGLNISYQFKNGTVDGFTKYWLFSKVNTSEADCYEFVNGSYAHCGFDEAHTPIYNVSNENFTFYLDDTNVYPSTNNFDPDAMSNERKLNFPLNTPASPNSIAKIQFFNFSSARQFGMVEVNVQNMSATSSPLLVYYCNSTYISGSPSTNNNCVQIGSITTATAPSHLHGNVNNTDYATFFNVNTSTGYINNQRKVTATSYILLTSNTGGWNVRYISNISRTGSSQTTQNSGTVWSNLAGTITAHAHQFNGTATLYWYAQGQNGTTNNITSSVLFDKLQAGGMPPSTPVVYNPTSTSYSNLNLLIINWTSATSPNGNAISNYTIYLLNSDDTINLTIANNQTGLNYTYNVSSIPIGFYKIGVLATDNLSQSSPIGESALFTLTTPFGVTSTLNYPYNYTPSIPVANRFEFNTNATTGNYGLSSGQFLGFNITVGKNTQVSGNFYPTVVSVNYSHVSNGIITVTIYNSTSTGKYGTALYTNITNSASFSGSTYTFKNFTMQNTTPIPVTLNSNTEYKIVFNHTSATGGRIAVAQGGYKGGAMEVVNMSNFLGFAGTTNDEAQFEIFGTQNTGNALSVERINNGNIYFNATLNLSNSKFVNYTLFIYNSSYGLVYNKTNETLNSVLTSVNTSDLYVITDGNYSWNVLGCVNDSIGSSSCSYSSNNGTFIVDLIYPTFSTVTINNVSTISMPTNLTFSVTVTDANLNTCYYTTSDDVTQRFYTCNIGQNISFTTAGMKQINIFATDEFGHTNSTSANATITFMNVTETQSAYDLSEGQLNIITLTLNQSSSIGDAEANLIWNNQNLAYTTKSVLSANSISFTSSFTVPTGSGAVPPANVSYHWTWNSTSFANTVTTNKSQMITAVSFANCSANATIVVELNLKDELTAGAITSSNTTRIEIDVLLTSKSNSSQTFRYNTTFLNNRYLPVCLPANILNNTNYTIDFTVGYDATGYVRKFFYLDNGTLDNTAYFNSYTARNISLYDLPTTDSTTFLFEFTDADGLEVDDAIVHVYRKYIGEGLFREVERAKQDNNGQTHVHLVEEDVIYYFMVTQYGNIIYTSDTYNAKCLSSPCEITLSASPTDVNWSIIDNEGGKYDVSTNKDTRIVTTSFNLDSVDKVNVSLYEISNGELSLVNTSTLTATSGNVQLHVPLSYGNKSYFVAIYNTDKFVKSEWVDLTERGKDYFGTTGAIFGGLIVLAIMLMAVSEGIGLIIFTVFALMIIGIMQLVDLGWMSLISIICAGGIIIFKLVKRRQQA